MDSMITYIPGRVVCPLAGVGGRAANASNRLVVDPSTEVTIAGSTLTLRDERPRTTKTPIADLVWLAEGSDGTRFTIHLEVTKLGRDYSIDLHTHEPRALRRDTVNYEPFVVVVDGRVLVDRTRLTNAVARVPLARRAAAALTTVRDHLAGTAQDPEAVGYRVLDCSIGVGAFGRGAMLVRARLTSLAASNAPLIARGSITEMLREGAWELSLEALTERTLPELVARDLELYGLADVPILRQLRRGNMRRGQVLAFRCIPGAPEVRLDDQRAPVPNALDIARAYLEFHMLGGMLMAAAIR